MEDENKKVVEEGTEKEKTPETPAEDPKKEESKEVQKPEAKKEKPKKASVAQRAKSAVKRNKKPIIAAVGGFVAGVGATIGGSMWLGHKHQQKMDAAAAMREPTMTEETYTSPLDPNVIE